MNAITYKEVFPLIQHNSAWLGNGFSHGNAYFAIPQNSKAEYAQGVYDTKTQLVKFRNCCWFTNIDHGRRHQPLSLMTMADNLKCSKHKEIRERGYPKYDNYDAIEVSYTDAIPSDYKAGMGVPISFLDKYCPEQFEIEKFRKGDDDKNLTYTLSNDSGTEREERFAQSHAILQDRHQEQDVMVSWASQSHSLINSAQSSSKTSDAHMIMGDLKDGQRTSTCPSRSEAKTSTSVFLSGVRSNGVMGVPISFLDKFCPEQFEIIGCSDNGRVAERYKVDHFKKHNEPYINGKKVYKRIFIKFRGGHMITTLRTDLTIKDICEGFVYNELEGRGLYGLSGKLVIQPEYQRNYIYADGKKMLQ